MISQIRTNIVLTVISRGIVSQFGERTSRFQGPRNMSLFKSKEKSMKEIREHLERYPGGSIELTKREDGLAIVALSHEQKKNAMSGKMMADLHDVVQELDSWTEGKGIILKGSPAGFCSGGDLDFVRQISTPEEGFMMSTFMQNVLNKFQRLPMISVALVEGIGALGGGAELSVACDYRLITETCRGIGFVHAKMGIIPAWGGTNRLVETVGYAEALELLSTAKILSPVECLNVGLVNSIIPASEDGENHAIAWLRERTRFNATLIRTIKTSVSSARDAPRDYETERRLFAPFWGSPGNREALEKNIKHKPES